MMGFLKRFLAYKKICIQCHNFPDADALASAYGLYCFFTAHGLDVDIVYGGSGQIQKSNLKYMIEYCKIPIRHVEALPTTELLLIVDGQYGAGNVVKLDNAIIAVIDHHIRMMPEDEQVLIKSDYQSCSTIIWELLEEEGYAVRENDHLCTALLYGLYTDTSSFLDLYQQRDTEMKLALSRELPLFEKLTKSNMTLAELMIASEAMENHYFDFEKRYAIVSAIRCDQSILGVIGDLMIQVDVISLSLTYTQTSDGYQLSIRSCESEMLANRLMAHLCADIGSGGGHAKKAGGRIAQESYDEKYGELDIFDYVNQKLSESIEDYVCPESKTNL